MKTLINQQNKKQRLLLLPVVVFVVFTSSPAKCKSLSETDVRLAVTTWVRQVTADAKPDAVIEQIEPHVVDGQTVAYIAHLKGGGYCLCGCDDLVLPVYLYSPKDRFNPANPGIQCILWEIKARTKYLTSSSTESEPALEDYQETLVERAIFWQQLIEGKINSGPANEEDIEAAPNMMVINFTPKWHQHEPFNMYCPTGDTSCTNCCPGDPCGPCPPSAPTVVGCTATATAQIMKYWWWPSSGNGDNSYDWDGDDSCPQGGNPGAGAQELYAYFGDAYDWANMANRYLPDGSGGWKDENGNPLTQAHIIAAANLSYEAAVAVEMDFGCCGSGAPVGEAVDALEEYFYYDTDAYSGDREDVDEMIEEIRWLRPFLMGGHRDAALTKGHSWVVYGYNQIEPGPQFLMNMGWGPGNNDAVWYSCSSVPYIYNQRIGTQIAPASAVRFVGPGGIPFPSYDGSPFNAYPTFEYALSDEDLPDGTQLIFKAGSVHTFSIHPTLINKPLTLKGHEAIIN